MAAPERGRVSERERGEGSPIHSTGDRRTGETAHDHRSFYDFFVDLIRGGLGQTALLTLPALWILASTPVYTVEVATGAVVSIVTLSLLLALFRGGHLESGRQWPVLSGRTLSTNAGWRSVLTRSIYLSSTLSLAAYGGVLVEAATGLPPLNALVALALSALGLALLPSLSADSRPVRLRRFGYCLLGLLPMAVVLALAIPAGIDLSIVLAALLLIGALWVDTRPLGE